MTEDYSAIIYSLDRIVDNCVSIVEETLDHLSFVNFSEDEADEESKEFEKKKEEETNKEIELLKQGELPRNIYVINGTSVTKKYISPDEYKNLSEEEQQKYFSPDEYDDAVKSVKSAVTKRVNGGTIGLADRIKHFKEYYKLLTQ